MNHKQTRKEFVKYLKKNRMLKQIVLRDNKTGRFISKKRFKQLSKKRTSTERIYA